MKIKLLSLLVVFFTLGCKKTSSQDQCKGLGQYTPCTKEYMPVCGCDGITYGNDCMAEASGVKSWTEGSCDEN